MEQFEVIEHRDGKSDRKNIVYCINYINLDFVIFSSNMPLKKGDLVMVDGDNVYPNKMPIGKVLKRKSSSDVNVDTSYDIKYTGGYSLDGRTIYLDEHFPRQLTVEGKMIDTLKSIGLHHELPEKWLSDEKYEYPYAHEIATGIEKEYVESLGVN